MGRPIEEALGSPYVGYAYSYPHKTAYRPFSEPLSIDALWRAHRGPAMLYVHVPFCEFRCGFCNLFTEKRAPAERTERYIAKLVQQASVLEELPSIAQSTFTQLAIGGGTPTVLDVDQLERVVAACMRLGLSEDAPKAIETSPGTISAEHVRWLEARGFERVSIGVQSFEGSALSAIGRPSKADQVERALDLLASSAIPVLNIDLIYGAAGQSTESWLQTVRRALRWAPQHIYLYPLYVRARTGIEGRRSLLRDDRLEHYRRARDLLRAEGYAQRSMRMFERDARVRASAYRCQEDAMLGLGCGARSYTRNCHYADEWAVSAHAVSAIVERWMERERSSFAFAHHGFHLSLDEQRRRYLMQMLLQTDGLLSTDYASRFGEAPEAQFDELRALENAQLAVCEDGRWRLSDAGMERSDAIGPWLYSDAVRKLSEAYELR